MSEWFHKHTTRLSALSGFHQISVVTVVALGAALAVRVSYLALIEEDAFITFRVIDNFINGFGLRWNIDERVQPFTHPLWLFVHLPFAWIFHGAVDISYVSFGIGLIISLIAFWLAADPVHRNPVLIIGCVFAPLMCSRSLAAFSVSGLENPLTHALLAAFVTLLLRDSSRVPWFGLSLVASLGVLNRMDTALIFLPVCLLLAMAHFRNLSVKAVSVGVAPLVVWAAFSLFYYGFVFPTSKYSKLDTGIPRIEYIERGMNFAVDLFLRDLPGGLILIFGIGFSIYSIIALLRARRSPQSLHFAGLGMGVLVYSGYVVFVGGDYMSGRFWTPVIFLSMLLLSRFTLQLRRSVGIKVALAALIVLSAAFASPRGADPTKTWKGIRVAFDFQQSLRSNPAREGSRASDYLWRNTNSVFHRDHPEPPGSQHIFAKLGLNARLQAERKLQTRSARGHAREGWKFVSEKGLIGLFGFYAGPDVAVIDAYGIGDILMSRLPMKYVADWRVGHYRRLAPDGYKEARSTGNLATLNPDLAEYYRRLRTITAGPLFSLERLKTIVAFNLGAYDPLLDAYRE